MAAIAKPDKQARQIAPTRSTCPSSLRELTRRYFAHENKFQFVIELLLFAVIVAISAWPILGAASALDQFLRVTGG